MSPVFFPNEFVSLFVPLGFTFISTIAHSPEDSSNSKNLLIGKSRALESFSRVLNEGALIPRSIKLRKSTEISAKEASCSCVRFACLRSVFNLTPNFSCKIAIQKNAIVVRLRKPPSHTTGGLIESKFKYGEINITM